MQIVVKRKKIAAKILKKAIVVKNVQVENDPKAIRLLFE